MNEELEKSLADLVRKGIEAAEKTGEFVIEQAPELLQQFYMWHTAMHIMGIMFGVVLASMFFIVRRQGEKSMDDVKCGYVDEPFNLMGRWFSDSITNTLLIVGSGIASIVGVAITVSDIFNLVFILVAPKLYLIEYFLK